MDKPRTSTNPKDTIGRTKAPLRLVAAALPIYVSIVQELGGSKYGPYNWRQFSVSHATYLEAAWRHLLLALDGEDVDPETGVPHEASVAACMGIILDAMTVGKLIDDRYKTGKVAGLLAMARVRCAEIRARHGGAPKKSRQRRRPAWARARR